MTSSPLLSIVTPVYRSEPYILPLYDRLKSVLESSISHDFELIMVDDASPDNSWLLIEALAERDPRVKAVRFSRNFGQYIALTAGLDHVRGEWVVIMDCDLQDQPEEIPKLYRKALEGYDIVLAQRVNRRDSWLKRFSSRCFNAIFSYLTDAPCDASTAQFGVYHHQVIQTITSMRERLRYLPALIRWVGYRTIAVPVSHARREEGKSGYSLKKLINLALDSIIGFSDKPLRLTVKLGLLIAVAAFLAGIFLIFRSLAGVPDVVGWPSLMVAICFFSGLMVFLLGLTGLYVAKIFEEVKRRPLYIIRQSTGMPSLPVDALFQQK